MHRIGIAAAVAGLASAQPGAAQGIELYGEAWLGLGYNIDNEGEATGEDDLRAVSSVSFGVTMAGETDGGISFGADIDADVAEGGDGGDLGQSEGSVFVSGDFGTLTFGDADGADYFRVGDVPGNLSLTGLGDLEETLFISNGGEFGDDDAGSFAANPLARPTVRYDIEFGDFGLSLSSNRDLTDIQVGAGYEIEFDGASLSFGIGYNDFAAFVEVDDDNLEPGGEPVRIDVPAGTQWSAGVAGEYASLGFGVIYTQADVDSGASFDTLAVGATFEWEAATLGAYYQTILNAEGGVAANHETESYGLTASYDLGGGAELAGGVVRTFGSNALGEEGTPDFEEGDAGEVVADFGILLTF